MSLDTDSKMDNSCNNTLEIKTNSTTPAESANLSLDTLDADTIINLISKQGEKFEVSKKCAFISNLVKTSLDTDTEAKELPLPGVSTTELTKIVEYMKHHNGKEPDIVEKPLRSKIMKDVCKDPW